MAGVLAFAPMVAALVVIAQLRSPANDYFQFWYAGHLVATGHSPYDLAAWGSAGGSYGSIAGLVARSCELPNNAACIWAYPPWVGWLFAPFGLFDPERGTMLQEAFLFGCAVAGVVYLTRFVPLSHAGSMVVGFSAVAAAPFVWATFLGQFDGLLLLGTVLLTVGLRDRRTFPLVAGAIVLAFKPNLFVAIVPLTIALLVVRRDWRALTLTAATLVGLAVVAIVLDPMWLGSLGRATTKVGLTAATTWSLMESATSDVALLSIGLVVVASAGAAWASIRARTPIWDATFVASGVALSLVLAPYAHLYDYLLLAPAIAVAIATFETRGVVARPLAFLAYGGGFIAVTWIAFLNGPHGDESPANALIPPAIMAGLTLAVHWPRSRTDRGVKVPGS